MHARTPRISPAKAQELVAAFRQLDERGKLEFLEAVAQELKAEYGTDKALQAVVEHLRTLG